MIADKAGRRQVVPVRIDGLEKTRLLASYIPKSESRRAKSGFPEGQGHHLAPAQRSTVDPGAQGQAPAARGRPPALALQDIMVRHSPSKRRTPIGALFEAVLIDARAAPWLTPASPSLVDPFTGTELGYSKPRSPEPTGPRPQVGASQQRRVKGHRASCCRMPTAAVAVTFFALAINRPRARDAEFHGRNRERPARPACEAAEVETRPHIARLCRKGSPRRT